MRHVLCFVFLLAAGLMLTGCFATSGASVNPTVLGAESHATNATAVNQMNLMLANATGAGCRVISIGGGAGTGGEMAQAFVVDALLECPAGLKLLPGTGAPIPQPPSP